MTDFPLEAIFDFRNEPFSIKASSENYDSASWEAVKAKHISTQKYYLDNAIIIGRFDIFKECIMKYRRTDYGIQLSNGRKLYKGS
jgi:hypothetical protein